MSNVHSGNMLNSITYEEHDGEVNAKKVTLVSGSTIFAVVNTGAGGVGNSIVTVANTPLQTSQAGNVTLDPGSFTGIKGNLTIDSGNISLKGNVTLDVGSLVGIRGNLTLSDSKGYVGLVTIGGGLSNVAVVGNVTLSDSKTFIGLATTVNAASPAFIGIVTIANTNIRAIAGNVTLSDAKTYIGLVTIGGGLSNVVNVGNVTLDVGSLVGVRGNLTLSDSKGFIGLTTTTLGASPAFVGIVTIANSNARSIIGNVTLDVGSLVGIRGNITLSDSKTYIGLTTSTLGLGTTFIGLVTAVTQNAGTNKTLIFKPVAFAQASIVTIAVATANFKLTHLVLNSNATVRLNIKSGVTYLTGNVSLGMNINPGGGWVENGSPDSPVYISLSTAQGIVIEKLDLTGTSAQIGGKLIYVDEF